MKKIAIVQSSNNPNTATEALDVALALASFDTPVQLILINSATDVLVKAPSKRYAMLDLLDAEPIALCSNSDIDIDALPANIEVTTIKTEQLKQHLNQFDEVLQFS
ncbi:hypothetical protein AWR38_07035 [Idiomarina sp. WRN-38]|uniref:DsrE family protein n=1 Tax=Idiomarina sp. OXR-189 TaxID=3100175 RepID=UPI0007335074|nr:DsrE family protein [Idiomarina sp. OXR-189]KTG23768.1 hypothetical protein AUR68_07020 [Idiomarina sp. H105]OAE91159.1 hypothetical protein AWR38_07035 [Idiomarina sp. WRN-38]WPZ02521.1 DsrE family protein [Idiomarina sp. OXR-189]